MAIENSVFNDFDLCSSIVLTFSIAAYLVRLLAHSAHIFFIILHPLLRTIRLVLMKPADQDTHGFSLTIGPLDKDDTYIAFTTQRDQCTHSIST